jgi:transketolase
MFAAHHNLSNLTAIVDRNNIQINGVTSKVMGLEPLKAKWESFGWHVIEVDGHNIEAFVDAVHQAHAIQQQPTCIITHTIPGKGIKEIENKYEWHGKPPSTEEEQRFLKELRSLGGRIEAGHMD